MALASATGAGSSGIGCAAGRVYTGYTGSVEAAAGSGLFVAWVVVTRIQFYGIG